MPKMAKLLLAWRVAYSAECSLGERSPDLRLMRPLRPYIMNLLQSTCDIAIGHAGNRTGTIGMASGVAPG